MKKYEKKKIEIHVNCGWQTSEANITRRPMSNERIKKSKVVPVLN
jgi:hypothetical protein